MAYTPNNPYIPGDPYSYDLKWIISQLKTINSSIAGLDDKIQAAVIAALDQHDPIYYKTAAELIASGQKAGSIAYIEGYNAAGDGGANLYYVTDDYNDIINAAFYLTMEGANKWALPIILTPYVTPEMFGAVGDGITDDKEPLRIAIANYPIIIGSKTYYIGGEYPFSDLDSKTLDGGSYVFSDFKFTDCVNLKIQNVKFIESNKTITLTNCENVIISDCNFSSNNDYASPRFVEIYGGKNIHVEKNNINNVQYGVIARPYSTPTNGLYVIDCKIANTKNYSFPAGVNIAEAYNTIIKGNIITGVKAADTYGYGIYTGDQEQNDPDKIIIDSNFIDNCNRGIRFHQITNVKIVNNIIINCASVVIETMGDTSTATGETITKNIYISGNTFDNFMQISYNTQDIIITDNIFERGAVTALNYGITLQGDVNTRPTNVSIESNMIKNPQRAGIFINFGRNVKIIDNTIINANTSSEGTVYARGGIALYIADNTLISNNKVQSNLTALLINANSQKAIYTDNELDGVNSSISGGYTALPTSGKWNIGEKGYYQNPSAAGYIGFVCTASGDFSSGTAPSFQNFGALV